MARVRVSEVTKSWMRVEPDHMDKVKVVVRHHGGSKVESVEHEVGTRQDDVVAYIRLVDFVHQSLRGSM